MLAQLAISNSRWKETLEDFVESLGGWNSSILDSEYTVELGKVSYLPCNTIKKNYELPLPEVFNGKIVINETNSYSENWDDRSWQRYNSKWRSWKINPWSSGC